MSQKVNDSSQPAKKTSGFWKSIRTNIKSKNQAFSIKPIGRNGKLPLSFGQQRLWLIEQLQPGNPVHNLRAAFRLQGALDLAFLEKSIGEIVRRHEILRTTFPTVNGQPIQVISPERAIELPLIDLEGLPTQQQEEEVYRLSKEVAQQPFDLAEGPLIRLKLLRLAEKEHVLLRTIHHIINDIWSDTVFIRELAKLYEAFCAGKPSPLPELPIQYVDFAQCQRQWLQGEVMQSQLDYWKQQLQGKITLLNLPTDYSPPTVPNYRGAAQFLVLSKDLTEALKALQYNEGVSLFVILLAAFKTLLYQYSGQEDLILCSPVAGRQQMETKKLIGYFSNLVLLRTDLGKNPSFRELVSRVSKVTLGATEHQYLPFQQLVESVGVPSTILSRTMFALQNVPSKPQEMAGIRVSLVEMEEGIANFDLSLSMKEKGEQLIGILRYKTDLFKESTIKQMLDNFQTLLEELVANRDLHLASLPLYNKPDPKPAPELNPRQSASFVPPQTPLQELLANIYASVLEIKQVGIHDNFFELGGHSLRATQLISRLRETFAVEIPLSIILEAPTVAELEGQLNRIRETSEQLPIVPAIATVSRQQDLPLSFAQQRLWFLNQLLEGDLSAYNSPMVWQLNGELNIDALCGAFREIINRHEVLRTYFKSGGGIPRQVIEPECQLALPVIDLGKLSESEQSQQVQQLAAESANQPFDLEQAPLVRASILQLSEQKHILLLNVHHIAFDGWSRGIFLKELSRIYTALSLGQPSPL
ncbi:MAG: hypothetical protein F6K37_25590, partial [Moorea sp. SIO4E2]|uniref:condensation domain-containing protein n=1 Tax=Moorena sp. SIO4E2 TaxID=2607826 RepID=UPI0013BA44AE